MKRSSPFIRLQIADDSKDVLARQARRHALSQTELASRLVEWLVLQKPVVQATVLNNIKNDMEDQLAEMLRSIAAAKRADEQPGADRTPPDTASAEAGDGRTKRPR
ncbi:MAG: hypothetical protein JWO31_303 [Phycisphaerales bacterium]|nr:hypothetical protein [Phycisphaerales bacterium]